MSDIDTAVVDSLKVLDPNRPIREADIGPDLHCAYPRTLHLRYTGWRPGMRKAKCLLTPQKAKCGLSCGKPFWLALILRPSTRFFVTTYFRHNVVTGRDFATHVNSLIDVSHQEGWLIELCRVLAAERIGNKAVSSAILTAQKWLIEQNDTNEIDEHSNFSGNYMGAFAGNAAFAGVVERRALFFENVPPPDLNFTGRDRLVRELHQLLSDRESLPAVRIAAIHGLGGIGKTLLASEYAHLHSGAFSGVWWAPAQERSVLVASLAALAARFDERLANEPNQERAARTGLAHLAAKLGLPYLLIYDNVESPDALRDLLPIAGARVIVTTRWADWGGQAIEVKLDTLENAAATAFLQKRAMRDDPEGAARLAASLGNLRLLWTTPAPFAASRKLALHPTSNGWKPASGARPRASIIRPALPPPLAWRSKGLRINRLTPKNSSVFALFWPRKAFLSI